MLRDLLSLIRFSHTIFALPFALTSAILAWQDEPFRVGDLVGILLCMVFARSAAMAFNRIVDRKFDALNPRTQQRHLPAGTLSLRAVVLFTIVAAGGFIASTTLFLFRDPPNPWPLYLAVPVLLFVLGYSLTKRFMAFTHVWLGFALALAPLAAWIAIRGPVELLTPCLLSLAVGCWVTGFDLLYSCQDVDFDRHVGLHSLPARIGVRASLRVALGFHLVMLMLLFAMWYESPHLEMIFVTGLFVIGVVLLYQHSMVSPDNLTRVNAAFFGVNAIVSVGMFLLVVAQVIIGG